MLQPYRNSIVVWTIGRLAVGLLGGCSAPASRSSPDAAPPLDASTSDASATSPDASNGDATAPRADAGGDASTDAAIPELDASVDASTPDASTPDASTLDASVAPRCEPTAAPACDDARHELPIPTHWDATLGRRAFLASDPIWPLVADPLGAEPYVAGACYPVYVGGFVPGYEHYYAEDFTEVQPGDDAARAWARDRCLEVGVPVRHVRPPRADGAWSGTGPTSGSCEVQIVHAQEVEGSLITVFLPPGWSATAPAGTYPIVFNGFYDLNRNTFEQHGPFLARLVGQSSLGGRRGVVGVLWNGGGAEVSRTFDERAYVQFARIVDEIAARYGGHRRWIVTFGGSRGAVTALGMASNPRGHDQRVVLAAGVAPATLVGDHAELMGPTYPGLMHAVGWSTGLADAWRTGWRYPSCGRAELVGLTGMQAALQIMIGTSDRATANARSLLSGAWLDGLVAAGTQVHLEVTAHDFICPFALQLRYARALQARGVPVDLRVGVRAGHHDIAEPGHAQTIRDEVVESAIAVLTDPSLDLDGAVPSLVAPGTRYYRVDRATSADEEIPTPAATPFTVDLPYVVARGQRVPAVAVGAPGTEWRLGYAVPGLPDQIVLGEIGADETSVVFVDVPMDYPVGTFGCALEIRRPGATTYETIPPTSTPTGDTCTLTVVPEEPALDYGEVMTAARPPALPGRETSTWGLSEL